MNLIKILLFFISIESFASRDHQARYSINDDIICIDDLELIGYLGFFTWSMKSVLDKLAGFEFMNEKEWKVLEKNPKLLLQLKGAANFAIKNSETLCESDSRVKNKGIYGYADEVDAVRHFSMSAYLSLTAGEEAARFFMTAHENSKYKKDNMMGYYNNDLGYKIAKKFRHKLEEIPFGQKKKFIKELIKYEAKRIIDSRDSVEDFLVSTTSSNKCSREKYPNY